MADHTRQPASAPEPPRIEFPCAYPIKVVGNAAADFREFVVAVMERHAGPLADERVEVVASRSGKYLSVRVTITATGVDQLQAIHRELKDSGRVHTVL
jgi:putative lipoic acid-binding regulatory protein